MLTILHEKLLPSTTALSCRDFYVQDCLYASAVVISTDNTSNTNIKYIETMVSPVPLETLSRK